MECFTHYFHRRILQKSRQNIPQQLTMNKIPLYSQLGRYIKQPSRWHSNANWLLLDVRSIDAFLRFFYSSDPQQMLQTRKDKRKSCVCGRESHRGNCVQCWTNRHHSESNTIYQHCRKCTTTNVISLNKCAQKINIHLS